MSNLKQEDLCWHVIINEINANSYRLNRKNIFIKVDTYSVLGKHFSEEISIRDVHDDDNNFDYYKWISESIAKMKMKIMHSIDNSVLH